MESHPSSSDGLRTKRLKLRNAVFAEMEEAIRYSLLHVTSSPSNSLMDTLYEDISTVIRYSNNVPECTLFTYS